MTIMKQIDNDKELKKGLEALYAVQPDDAFVDGTLQRLPSRGTKLLWTLLGNVAIWGTVFVLAYCYFDEIVLATASVLNGVYGDERLDYGSCVLFVVCAVVLLTAVIHSLELVENYYRLLIDKRLESISKPK